jgi:hypothetical protein
MKSKLRLLSLGIIGLLLLSACHRLHVTTEIQTDGSGELRTEAGYTAEERQNLEAQSGNTDPQTFCNPNPNSPEAVVTEEQRGDETWCITTQPFDNLEKLRQLYETRRGLRINRLEIQSGTLYYDIDIDTTSETSDFSTTTITWTVTLPDAPIYHNAAQAEGNTLTWTLTPDSGLINLRAESPAQGPLELLPLLVGSAIVLGLCAATLLGGGVVFVLMRRQQKPPPRAAS